MANKKHPGLATGIIDVSLNVRTQGGTVDGHLVSLPVFDGMLAERDGQYYFTVAVRATDGAVEPLQKVNFWVENENTFDDSERYAKNLSRRWHLETYVFDRFERPGRLWRKQAVYHFVEAKALVATPGARRWYLKAAGPIALPSGSAAAIEASSDRWDTAYRQIEEACATFARIAALDGDPWLTERVAGPVKAVQATRAEARRLAALGQQLDTMADPSDDIVARENQVLDRLTVLHRSVQDAVAYLSDVHLRHPDALDRSPETANHEIATLAAGFGEVHALGMPQA